MGGSDIHRAVKSARQKKRGALAAIALTVVAGVGLYLWLQHRITDRLLKLEPSQIIDDSRLLQAAVDRGRPLYQNNCASCHGVALQGSLVRGVPNLAKNAWLYGSDPVGVERTILYGIRSGHPKAHNVMDMPALVRSGQLSEDEARDVVEYLESLANVPVDADMTARGRLVYYGKGNCFDCHAGDARGATDYGSPPLTGPIWLYGGDRSTLYRSIQNGRHGVCPAWVDRLSPLQIRSLTLYLWKATPASAGLARN